MKEDMTAISILALFQTNKEQRQSFCANVINDVVDGNVNALNVHLQIKAIEDIVKQIKDSKEYVDAVNETASTYGKSFEYMNAKIDTREVGVKYDFSKTNDIEYFNLNENLDVAKKSLKNREEFLKCMPLKGVIVTNEETGETTTIYPPSKKSTTSIVVTLL